LSTLEDDTIARLNRKREIWIAASGLVFKNNAQYSSGQVMRLSLIHHPAAGESAPRQQDQSLSRLHLRRSLSFSLIHFSRL